VDLKTTRFYARLGEVLGRLRRGRDLTQKDLASACGLSRATLSNIERGAQQPYVHQLFALLSTLGAGVDSLGDLLPETARRAQSLPLDRLERRFVESGLREERPK
jgi:putative transcriptional regulator